MTHPLDAWLHKLGHGRGRRVNSNEIRVYCPIHEAGGQGKPSLTVTWSAKGKPLVTCWSENCGASQEDLWKACCEYGLPGTEREKRHESRQNRKMSGNGPQAANQNEAPAAAPAAEPRLPDEDKRDLGRWSASWEYTDADGRPIMWVCRFPLATDDDPFDKTYRPWAFKGGKWDWQDPEGKLPLYGLAELAAHPAKLVLVVEGEKTVDHARDMLPGYAVVTWPHGAKAAFKTDWSPLRGRRCLLWPDNDEDGRAAMGKVKHHIEQAGGSAQIAPVPQDLPPKWDLADPFPDGWSEERILELLRPQLPSGLCLTLADWSRRETAKPDFILGEVFSTTTRAILAAETGAGKTHLGFAIGFRMAAGWGFCHWSGHRPARVLIIDGEMSADLVKRRLDDEAERMGLAPENLFMLCAEDCPDMPPLDTLEGQAWLDTMIEELGGVDFLILDNVMSLTIGDLKLEEDWKPVIPWMKTLTRRRIGILWIHHTGHDGSKGYGTKTREWQLDTVMLGEAVQDANADLAMQIQFTKCRQRRPENREDYQSFRLLLTRNEWTTEPVEGLRKAKPLKPNTKAVLECLIHVDDLAQEGKILDAQKPTSSVTGWLVTTEAVRNEFIARHPDFGDKSGDNGQKVKNRIKQQWKRGLEDAKKHGFLGFHEGRIWRVHSSTQSEVT